MHAAVSAPAFSLFWKTSGLPAPFQLGFTTRHGGTSQAPFDSLNLALHVGDDPRRVRENRRQVFAELGISGESAVVPQQVHGAEAALVSRDEAGRGMFTHADAIPGVDALVTRERNLPLVAFSADCLLVALGDVESGVCAVAHCGWRGLVAGVLENTIRAMAECGANAARICAYGSPSIGPCCFEVGADVASQFGEKFVHRRVGEKAFIDLRAAAAGRLSACGLDAGQLNFDTACTCCESEAFFSHRRSTKSGSPRTGRMALIVSMK